MKKQDDFRIQPTHFRDKETVMNSLKIITNIHEGDKNLFS